MKYRLKILIAITCFTLSSLSLATEEQDVQECDPLETSTPMQNYCAGLGFCSASITNDSQPTLVGV